MGSNTEERKNLVLLSREEILNSNDLEPVFVPTPEWAGGNPDAGVLVRPLSGFERDNLEKQMIKVRKNKAEYDVDGFFGNFRAKICSMCIVDENGQNIFTPADVEALGRKNAGTLSRVSSKAQEISAFTDEDVEEIAGNSDSGQSDSST